MLLSFSCWNKERGLPLYFLPFQWSHNEPRRINKEEKWRSCFIICSTLISPVVQRGRGVKHMEASFDAYIRFGYLCDEKYIHFVPQNLGLDSSKIKLMIYSLPMWVHAVTSKWLSKGLFGKKNSNWKFVKIRNLVKKSDQLTPSIFWVILFPNGEKKLNKSTGLIFF